MCRSPSNKTKTSSNFRVSQRSLSPTSTTEMGCIKDRFLKFMGLQHIAGFVVLRVLENLLFRLSWVGSYAMINEVSDLTGDLGGSLRKCYAPGP